MQDIRYMNFRLFTIEGKLYIENGQSDKRIFNP